MTHRVWVRTLPAPFDGNVDSTGLKYALKANKAAVPDVVAVGMQYIAEAPVIFRGGLTDRR